MTVKELIEQLQKVDPYLEVVTTQYDSDYDYDPGIDASLSYISAGVYLYLNFE